MSSILYWFPSFLSVFEFFNRFLRLLCFFFEKQTFPRYFKILSDFSRSFETFRDFSRTIEGIEALETHQSNNLDLTLAVFWNKSVALTQSWVIRASVVLVTCAILAALLLLVIGNVCSCAAPPLVGSAILQPKSASAGLSPNCAKHVQILVGSWELSRNRCV